MGFKKAVKKTRGVYKEGSREPFKLSRSKIELFRDCPRCFYLDRVRGVGRPPGFPFNLNSAVDKLLKKEFDIHRVDGTSHPLMKAYKIDAVPFSHPDIDVWRENFQGVQVVHAPSNLLVTGAVDDLWVNRKKELHVVDYKATSKETEVTLDAPWQDGYKRQMEVYQWLLRRSGFKVHPTGYFVYCNGRTDRAAFDAKLEFDVKVIPYSGDDGWIEGTLSDIRRCLDAPKMPDPSDDCEYCSYRALALEEERQGRQAPML